MKFLTFFISIALSFGFETLTHAVDFQFKTNGRVVSIGDIHGDFEALTQTLVSSGLVDERLKWKGRDAYLIFTGDLVDRGPDSRKILDTVLRLTEESAREGGKVIALNGNHEQLWLEGDYSYALPEEIKSFKDLWVKPGPFGPQALFSPQSVYGKWFLERPIMVTVNDTLFVHAGVEPGWFKKHSIEEINYLTQGWLKYAATQKNAPHPSTRWLVGSNGPLWTRTAAEIASISKSRFNFLMKHHPRLSEFVDGWKAMLKTLKIKRIVVGHTPQDLPLIQSPAFGRSLIIGDTGMSRYYGGPLTWIEYFEKEHPRATHPERPFIRAQERRVKKAAGVRTRPRKR